MSVTDRLAQLGLELPKVPTPAGAYVPALVSGDLVFTAGQIPLVDGSLQITGKVGDAVSPEQATGLARQCALNAVAALAAVADLDTLQIVKVVGFVASDPSFSGQPSVINGASELLGEVFGDRGVHARSAVGVAVLPLDSPVEVEVIARIVG